MLELVLRYLLHRFVGRALHRGADKALRSFTSSPVRLEAGWPWIRIDGRAITKRLAPFLNDLPRRAFAAARPPNFKISKFTFNPRQPRVLGSPFAIMLRMYGMYN